jgi:hypothetical protein
VSPDFDGVDALRAQAGSVRVIGHCRCGCPSIVLEVPADALRLLGSRLGLHGRGPGRTGGRTGSR